MSAQYDGIEDAYPAQCYSPRLEQICARLWAGGLRLRRSSEPPLPEAPAGRRSDATADDRRRPGLLFLQFTKHRG